MRAARVLGGAVLLLASFRAAEAAPDRPSGAAIDLGAGTLERGEVIAGPLELSLGLDDRVMIGSYLVPWFAALLRAGSYVANGFVKARVARVGRYTASLESSFLYGRLNDLDGDGLEARAWVWPSRLVVDGRWDRRWTTTLELTGVLAGAAGERLSEQDTRVEGVALANSVHAGLVQRFRASRYFTFWARARLLVDHAPVRADAQIPLSESARINVRARANGAELSSGGSVMAGVHWTWGSFNLRAGLGYGHWILPWVQLPYGERTVTGDLDLYVRF